MAVPAVRDFFRARNVSDADAAEQYLPAATTARFSPARLRGDAADFRVAFALYLPEASRSVYASYLAVFRGDGTLVAAAPTDGLDDGPGSTHFDAVKLASATTVLAYSNVWDEEAGRPYVWDFAAGAAPEPLNELIAESSHDVQLAWGNDGGENDAYWSPAVWGVQKRRVRDGATLEKHSMEGCVDVNHAQLLKEDTLAVVSCREYALPLNSFIRMDRRTFLSRQHEVLTRRYVKTCAGPALAALAARKLAPTHVALGVLLASQQALLSAASFDEAVHALCSDVGASRATSVHRIACD